MARTTIATVFIALALCVTGHAQGKGPGGQPPAPRGPGGPGGPSGPGGPGGPNGPSGPNSNSPTNQPPSNGGPGSGSASKNGLQFGPAGRWWDDKSVTGFIGLRKDQQKTMDAIFDANKAAILNSYKTLTAQQAKLNTLNQNPQADTKDLFATIDAVNQARASLQKATTTMLLQIRSKMDAGQIAKLEQLH